MSTTVKSTPLAHFSSNGKFILDVNLCWTLNSTERKAVRVIHTGSVQTFSNSINTQKNMQFLTRAFELLKLYNFNIDNFNNIIHFNNLINKMLNLKPLIHFY